LDKIAVFDSSAVLAVIYGESGSDEVYDVLDRMRGALLSSVNLIEVHSKLLLNGLPQEAARQKIRQLRCEICPLDEEQARIASEMVTTTRPYGLSLGDRVCLALAIQRNATVYTADQAWEGIPLRLELKMIR
jgi:ribonuclease VapC